MAVSIMALTMKTMTMARLQQLIALGLSALAGLWALAAVHSGRPAWAGAGLAAIVLGYGLFMAVEFAVMWVVHGDDPTPRANLRQLLGAWWGAVCAGPRVFCWQQPFQSGRHPDHLPPQAQARAVLLVHGYVCNRGFWNRWMPRLRSRGLPHLAVTLEPGFGSIQAYAGQIEAAVRRIEQATGRAPVIVAHSMGGLAVRAWMAAHDAAARVHRVVTLGTPHHGTWAARWGWTANAREMRPGSALLRALEAAEGERALGRWTCYYSHCDNVVYPASTATLRGADNRHVPGRAHVHLMDHGDVFEEVVSLALEA